jgi:hypothetical protein
MRGMGGHMELSLGFPSYFVAFSRNDFRMHGFVTQRVVDSQ